MEKINIVFICPDIGLDFGRSRIVHQIVANLIKNNKYEITLVTNKNSNLDEYKNFNIKIEYIPISINGRNPIQFSIALLKFISLLRTNKIQIIHSHHRYSDLLVYVSSKFVKVKTLTTVHSYTFGFNKFSYALDRIICVSNDLKKHLENEFKISSEKLKVIYNGISQPSFKIEKNENTQIKKDKITVLCVGRFDFDKGQDILINAFEKIWETEERINLVLVGEYSPNIIKYALKNNDEIRKKFRLNFEKLLDQNHKKIRLLTSKSTPWEEISKADIVVIPSRIETFGLVALEAGMSGKCVVASNIGGLREIVNENKNGLLFEKENFNELSEKIFYLYENQNLIHKYGTELLKDIMDKFTIQIMMKKYIEIYNKLLQNEYLD
ncbi:MAG: glycosyltransferase family 4 protein [Ignavibacteriales bacterium]|nr:glycosyltransferase family 4 protein [Ignavibacteriales bacterium]